MTIRYDVVVVGAGAVGMLTALALAERGVGVLLVESRRLGGGQSGQSHGYLHQGYAYGRAEPQLPALFGLARSHWDQLAAEMTPVTTESAVAFGTVPAARRSEGFWRSCGLPVEPIEPPSWLGDGVAACYRSGETTLDLGHVLRALGARLQSAGVEFAAGEVLRTVGNGSGNGGAGGDGVGVEYADPSGARVVVAARAVVVAAGAGAAGLLQRSGLPAVVQCRKSHMLVLGGELPPVSAIFPEREYHGLFLASRRGPDRATTWLVSDFQSFDGDTGPAGELAGWWARKVLSTLRAAVAPGTLSGVDLLAGYSATKSGLLPQSGTVAHEFIREFLDGRVVVTSPSKLTLTPLAAADAARSVCAVLGLPYAGADWPRLSGRPVTEPAFGLELAGAARELWETSLTAVKEPGLLDRLPEIHLLTPLFAR